MDKLNWNPELLQRALTDKQIKLSEAMKLKPDIEEDYDNAKKVWECKEAELSLLYELDTNGDRISDPKIKFKVKNTKEYQQLWEDFISAKSQLRKCKMEISVLEREMKTLEQISITMSVDLKYLNK